MIVGVLLYLALCIVSHGVVWGLFTFCMTGIGLWMILYGIERAQRERKAKPPEPADRA